MSKLNVETIENLSATTSLNVSDIASKGEFSADTGATLVGFKANGIGAVATTVHTKLRESVSVKDFGAVGDGVADDTAAIQSAIDSLPLNPSGDGILSPSTYANGGSIFIPRGRYKITSVLTMKRGCRIVGESREGSQLLSFSTSGALRYLDSGRFVPDEICVENLSIWQDSSVTPTSGALVYVTDGPATVQAVTLKTNNTILYGGYQGVVVSAGIACSIENSLVSNSVGHNIEVKAGVGFTQSTSILFKSVYSQQSVTGSGFKVTDAAYCNFIGCASDSNARYGYELINTISVGIDGGAEENTLGGVSLYQCRATRVMANIIDNPLGTSHAVTLDQSSGTQISGVHSSQPGATGYSVYAVSSGNTSTTCVGLIRTGGWDNVAQRTNASHVLEINALNGFVGGVSRQWAFGGNVSDATKQLYNTGAADSGVTDGFVTDVEIQTSGTTNSAFIAKAKTKNLATTFAVLNGAYIQAPVKGAASTVTRYNSLLIDESAIGLNANANIAIGTSSPAVGTWNIYSASTRQSYLAGPINWKPATTATPVNNGDMTFELTSNTTLTVKVKGSDGTVRTATLSLA